MVDGKQPPPIPDFLKRTEGDQEALRAAARKVEREAGVTTGVRRTDVVNVKYGKPWAKEGNAQNTPRDKVAKALDAGDKPTEADLTAASKAAKKAKEARKKK